jgi:hypothetical protein
MQVKVLREAGYDEALRGMAYSFKDRAAPVEEWWEGQRERAEKRAPKLAPMDGGHNKFLESIQVWIDVEACRAFWSEYDTYRVGTTKQSESTMHTLSKRPPTQEDFEEGTLPEVVQTFKMVWELYNKDITILKENLPEGFLQRRIVCTNYKVLKNILQQREGHRYKRWQVFIDEIVKQVEHPELLTKPS